MGGGRLISPIPSRPWACGALVQWMQMLEHAIAHNFNNSQVARPCSLLGNSSRTSGGGLAGAPPRRAAREAITEAASLKEQRTAREEKSLLAKQ